MSNFELKNFTIGNFTVRIMADQDPPNPRKEWDNVTHMACWHGRYNLGDKQPDGTPEDYLFSLIERKDQKMAERIERLESRIDRGGSYHRIQAITIGLDALRQKTLDQYYIVANLYLYDHSGITISMGRHSCQWDSGPVGFIVVDREKAIKEWGHKPEQEYMDLMEGEVETYDQYLTGDVWGYVIENPNGEEVGSCWGFFGDEYCEKEARAQAACYQRKEEEILADEMKEDFLNRQFELAI